MICLIRLVSLVCHPLGAVLLSVAIIFAIRLVVIAEYNTVITYTLAVLIFAVNSPIR